MRELKLELSAPLDLMPRSRTLPRVRELKLEAGVTAGASLRRTLPRVRELKRSFDLTSRVQRESHPSQGA